VRFVVVLLTWTVATAVALAVAWKTKVGPVVFVVSRRHGVHSGDIVAFAVAYVVAAVVSVAVLSTGGPHSPR
jgi:hypothetical protein